MMQLHTRIFKRKKHDLRQAVALFKTPQLYWYAVKSIHGGIIAQCAKDVNTHELVHLGVDPRWRKVGVGRWLIRCVCEDTHGTGMHVRTKAKWAPFFLKCGFNYSLDSESSSNLCRMFVV